MAVGEAPGAEEDRLGMAFVGRSGRLLDEMLREAGLDPERDILIANVVKCRPPGNRVPAPAEVDVCILYLRRQIELIQPRLLLLLGATAVRHLLPSRRREKMAAIAGRIFQSREMPGRRLLVTYHPAFVLRNPAKRPEMVAHLKKAKRHRPGRGSR
jgi:DNA polymerase